VPGIAGSTEPLADTRGSSPCLSCGSGARCVPCVREVVPFGDVFVRCGALHTAAQLGCLHVRQDAVRCVAG